MEEKSELSCLVFNTESLQVLRAFRASTSDRREIRPQKDIATNGLIVDLLLLSLKYGLYPELYPKPVSRFQLIIPNNPEFGNFSTYFFSPSTESVRLPGLIIGAAQRSFIRHNTNSFFINSNQGGVSATFRQGFLRRIPVVKTYKYLGTNKGGSSRSQRDTNTM